MSELVQYSPRTTRLAEWTEEARATHQIAVSLAGTSFVPRSMQGRPDEVTGAILAGRELGLEPMAALRVIDIIDGTPSIRAVGLRGIVLAHGHKVWVEESTTSRAIVCGQRRGEQTVQRSVWSMERAKAAGLAGKKNWQAHGQAMLVARATAEVCRLIAADAIVGMPYVTEEIEDGEAGDAAGTVISTGKKTVQRRVKAEPAARPEPELPPEPERHVPVPEEGPAVPGSAWAMSPGQRAAIMASFNAAGMREPEMRRNLCHYVIGREIGSTAELSEQEYRAVMAELAARIDAKDRAAHGIVPLADPEEDDAEDGDS